MFNNKKELEKIINMIDLEEESDINSLMEMINLPGVSKEREIENPADQLVQSNDRNQPKELSVEYRNTLLEWIDAKRRKGDKESLQDAIKYYKTILKYEKDNQAMINGLDDTYKEILSLLGSETDESILMGYYKFCMDYLGTNQSFAHSNKMFSDLTHKLAVAMNAISRRMYVLSITLDFDNKLLTIDFKGEGHSTRVCALDLDRDEAHGLAVSARNIALGANSGFESLLVVGKNIGRALFRHSFLLQMFSECYRDNIKGIIEFKTALDYIEFPIELLYYADNNDFIATAMPIRKQVFNFGNINRKPLSIEYHDASQPLKAILVASGLEQLKNVNQEVRNIATTLLDRKNLFYFDSVTCLTDDQSIAGIDKTRVKVMAPTVENFEKELQTTKYHLFHYAGHGMFKDDGVAVNCGLILKNGFLYDLNALLYWLREQSSLRFIYYNSCKSGYQSTRSDINDLLGKTMTSLIAGVPTVIAMRWAILDESARMIAEKFYESFMKNGYPEIALKEAKSYAKIHLTPKNINDLSWAAPMLIMH